MIAAMQGEDLERLKDKIRHTYRTGHDGAAEGGPGAREGGSG